MGDRFVGRGVSGSGPRPFSGAVARLRRRSAPPTLLAKVQDCWQGAVGESVSEQAVPTAEREGVVTVSCRSAVWSAELAMLSTTLLEQLNQALPEGNQVAALRFVTRPQ
jgi:predicted nucleic acid-binding Zn ribbon protein